MAFKESKATFDSGNRFGDEMKRFISDEAGKFTSGENEAAAANVDASVEKMVRISAEKNKTEIKRIKQEVKEYKKEEKEIKKNHEHREERKEEKRQVKQERKEKSKEKNKENKKAASKLAVGNMLKAKKDVSNDLAGKNADSGNAFTDAKSGFVGTLATVANPMTYVKKFVAYLGAILAPYFLIFMTFAIVIIVVVALLFDILSPIKKVTDAISGFLSIFQSDTSTFTTTTLTDKEINDIVSKAKCNADQEKAIVLLPSGIH